jgi:hypothetical protein
MTVRVVDVHQVIHTCPSNPEPHGIDIRGTLVREVPGGPCLAPATIRLGDKTTTIPCRRHEPSDQQCDACRVVIVVRNVITDDLGYQGPDRPAGMQVDS